MEKTLEHAVLKHSITNKIELSRNLFINTDLNTIYRYVFEEGYDLEYIDLQYPELRENLKTIQETNLQPEVFLSAVESLKTEKRRLKIHFLCDKIKKNIENDEEFENDFFLLQNLEEDLGNKKSKKMNEISFDFGRMQAFQFGLEDPKYEVAFGEILLFLARSNGGKSHLITHVLCHFAKLGKKCFYASLEMKEHEVFPRILGNLSDKDIKFLRNNPDILKKEIQEKSEILGNIHAVFPEMGYTIEKLFTEIKNKNFDVIFIDYLGILHTEKKFFQGNRIAELEFIIEKLRNFAMDNGILLVTAEQVNTEFVFRNGENVPKPIEIESVRGSKKIGYTIQNIIAIEPENSDEFSDKILLRIIKCRNGEKGNIVRRINKNRARIYN